MTDVTADRARDFLASLREDVAYVEAGHTDSDCLGTLRVNRDLTRKYRDMLGVAERAQADRFIARANGLLGEAAE